MEMTVKKWGNSLATRIPKAIADSVGLETDQEITIKAVEGKIIITPSKPKKEYSLAELLKDCDSKKMRLSKEDNEWLNAEAVGDEIW